MINIKQRLLKSTFFPKLLSRSIKLVWWTFTLQLPTKVKEWHLSRSNIHLGNTYFAPQINNCCFAVPFEYQFEKQKEIPHLAVVCHMYYPEMIEEFKHYLLNIPFFFDLFITTDSVQKKDLIAKGLIGWSKGAVEIRLSPNRGRDISPKLVTCHDVYDRYEFFLHIHTKKSPHLENLAGWRSYLLETLLGSEEIVQSIFDAFASDPSLGMIAPEHFDEVRLGIGWGLNYSQAKEFASQLGIELSKDERIDFPSGSMFWGRSAALKPILNIHLSVMDFPPEDRQTDGTLGHIIERLYYYICEQAGYRWLKIARPLLMESDHRLIHIETKTSLAELIKVTQFKLLAI